MNTDGASRACCQLPGIARGRGTGRPFRASSITDRAVTGLFGLTSGSVLRRLIE